VSKRCFIGAARWIVGLAFLAVLASATVEIVLELAREMFR
jgi:hypothetical protein